MDKIKRKVNGINKLFPVYHYKEVDNIQYKHWRDVDKGDYGISDDGYIGECLSKKVYTDKKGRTKTYITMCYGVQWGSPNARLLYEPNKKAGIYNQVKPRSWKEREAGKTRTKNVVTAYVKQLLSDSKVDFKQLGKIYRPDQDIPEATVRRLFKQKEIQAMVDKKLDELLTNKGITEEMVLDLHLKALEMAESKSDVSNFLRATENFMKLLDMEPNKKITTDTLEIDYTKSIENAIEQEDKRMKLSRSTEEIDVEPA
tara:strand:- start:421 stop:1191 length:771 start_codon:yes stop_codon:yes gene_type:complete